MKSMKVCVIAIETMKIARIKGVVRFRSVAEKLIVIIATKFIWIPGVNPVIVPARIPKRIARINSIIIIVKRFLD